MIPDENMFKTSFSRLFYGFHSRPVVKRQSIWLDSGSQLYLYGNMIFLAKNHDFFVVHGKYMTILN